MTSLDTNRPETIEAAPAVFFDTENLLVSSRRIGIDGSQLLHEGRGQVWQFGIDAEGEITWMSVDDKPAVSVVSLDFQADVRHDSFAWRLMHADAEGREETKFFVDRGGLNVFKSSYNPAGVMTKRDEPVLDYTVELSQLLLLVNSEELEERVDTLNQKKQHAEENVGKLVLELLSKKYVADKINKESKERKKRVDEFGFGHVPKIVLDTSVEVDIEPRVVYTNFQTGQKMMYDPITSKSYWAD